MKTIFKKILIVALIIKGHSKGYIQERIELFEEIW